MEQGWRNLFLICYHKCDGKGNERGMVLTLEEELRAQRGGIEFSKASYGGNPTQIWLYGTCSRVGRVVQLWMLWTRQLNLSREGVSFHSLLFLSVCWNHTSESKGPWAGLPLRRHPNGSICLTTYISQTLVKSFSSVWVDPAFKHAKTASEQGLSLLERLRRVL